MVSIPQSAHINKKAHLNWTPFSSQETKRPLSVKHTLGVFLYGEQRSKIQELFSWFETNNTRRVFRWYRNPKTLSLKYDVPYRAIKNWIAKTRHDIDVMVDHRAGSSGRPKSRNLTIEDYKERYEILKKYQAFLQARRGKK